MRSRTPSFWIAMACVCAVATAVAVASEGSGADTKRAAAGEAAVGTEPAGGEDSGIWMEPPVLLSPDVPVHRVVVVGGPGGGTAVTGAVSSLGTTCEEDPSAVYCNTLGPAAFAPSEALATARIADDIALAGVGGCVLDRYVIRVTGDRNGDGSGTALGAYTVDFGLYEACPGAGARDPIEDTEGQVTVPAEEAGIIKEIVFHPSFGANVALPPNLYLGVRFSRDLCGTVVGAPATLGFSADRFDFPGFPCAAGLGGFPYGPHASFYAEIYVEGDCPDAFVGYKNSNHSGTHYSAGVRARFADDVRLGVIDCNMVAYEIAHKGDGIIGADLRSFLSNTDPDRGGLIPGTTLYCFSTGSDVQVCRKELETPIPLPPSAFYVTYQTSSGYTGPLQTCKRANPGDTANFFLVYAAGEWRPQEFDSGCWGGFELTIFCEDIPPIGACCDMTLTDQDGEAVCRDNLPQMNCANPSPLLWKEDRECASTCIGGDNAGEPCTRQADCPEGICPGPFNHPCGVAACCKPEGGCQNLTENECFAVEPVDRPRMYQRDQFCGESGQRCPIPACLAREGECTLPREAFCVAGDRHGLECHPFVYPTECPGQTCLGGPRDGEDCNPDNQCPDGGECVDFICDGGSNNGGACNPNVECLPGGECTLGLCIGDVGCENPFCCTSVCQQPGFAYCCQEYWDELCAAETFRVCEQPPSNDNCSSPDPRDGARLVDIPSFAESDGIHSTVGPGEPGFCCNVGHECCPDLQPGSRGTATVWYKFVAPANGECEGGERAGQFCDPNAADPENPVDGCPDGPDEGTCQWLPVSVGLDTCCSVARGGTVEDPGGWVQDTLLQVFALSEPDRGLCGDDLTVCSVSLQDCPDGSPCEFDEVYACETLIPIACSDDEETCSCQGIPQPTRSKACARDLVPGETYYVSVGAKTNRLNAEFDAYIDRGVYKLRVWSPCAGDHLMDNDLTGNAELLAGEHIEVPFDISGEAFNRAPATFDCPGPPVTCFDVTRIMMNDVWYEWTAPCDGKVTIQTCGFDEQGEPSDDFTDDTTMVVYDGCETPVVIGTELACRYFEPSPCFLGSKVEDLDVTQGNCYKIRLGGRLGMTHDDQGDPIDGDLRIDVVCCTCGEDADCDDGLFCNGPERCPDDECTCFVGTSPCFGATPYCDEDNDVCAACLTDDHCPVGENCVDYSCVVPCPVGAVAFLDPPSGVVDARQPNLPADAGVRQGIDTLLASGPAGAANNWFDCWSLCETAVDGSPNAITNVSDNGDGTYTVTLDRTISTGAVTTITYHADDGVDHQGVFTSHPANVNGDSQATPTDILKVIDYINGVGGPSPWGLYCEDVDQSGALGPPDILRTIDLLNGAGVFDPWLNTPLPECGVCCP
ncbi:MAG: hypothetical protein JSU86_17830 [Phycisphaerales bacterium]|nr:MAG: hypothetical protein JSU86_17830 [Phycisphaerales bacterium]